jgi:G3E family GTPase
LRALAPRARIVPAQRGELPLDVVLGFDEARWGAFLDGAAPSHQPARLFASFVFEADRPFCEAKLRAMLDILPPAVLRAKGFVRTQEETLVLQAVGARWELRPGPPDPGGRTRIAVIGIAAIMNEPDLRERLSQALVDAT